MISSSYSSSYVQQHKVIAGTFPSYYYPTAFSKQPNIPLSPRQADAVERQRPGAMRGPQEIPVVITPSSTPKSSLVPRFPSDTFRPNSNEKDSYPVSSPPGHSAPSVSVSHRFSQVSVPGGYADFVAAPPSPYSSSSAQPPQSIPAIEVVSDRNQPPVNYAEFVAAPVSPRYEAPAKEGNSNVISEKNLLPSNYSQFVAAPLSPRGFGNYPEITKKDLPMRRTEPGPTPLVPLVSRPQYFYESDEDEFGLFSEGIRRCSLLLFVRVLTNPRSLFKLSCRL